LSGLGRNLTSAAIVGVVVAGCGGQSLSDAARDYRRQLRRGATVGELAFPRLHAAVRVRNGFDQAAIDRGPGWFSGSYLPGEGRLIYVAGHRQTHGGPFRRLGELRRGDRVVFTTPYATATYVVARRERISERRRSILLGGATEELRLQASTIPPSHDRLIVFARLGEIRPRD